MPIATVNTWYRVGSANELPGRTGFAHLFEHLMFMGSGHAPYGEFDSQLESVGGGNNASTANDRTNYYIDVPSNALELALFLESDRMGYLLDAMKPKTVDAQRDVVKNERRQSYENRPYGMADITLNEMLYPEGHPYHWPVIGYMEDLTAATYEDVVNFFKTYYSPSNASLVVAGDIDPVRTRQLVEKWFSDVKPGPAPKPMTIPGVGADGRPEEDDHRPRAASAPHARVADAAALRARRLRARHRRRRAGRRQEFAAVQAARLRPADRAGRVGVPGVDGSVVGLPDRRHAAARPYGRGAPESHRRGDREAADRRTRRRASSSASLNQIEASFYNRMERVGGFGGKADQINGYFSKTGDPDYFNEDLGRYRALSPSDIRAAAAAFLPRDRRVELIVSAGEMMKCSHEERLSS